MNPRKQFQSLYAQVYKNIFSNKWPCLIEGCKKTAINSHLLQHNSILEMLAENGHLYEIRPLDVYRQQINSLSLEFRLIGISRALSLPLFCNEHDTSTFKIIETEPINFLNYKAQFLLSFRAVCAETRKKSAL
jgi:hypothetical protein